MTVVPEEPLSEAVRVVRPGVDDAVAAADNGGRLLGGSRRRADGQKGAEQVHARWQFHAGPAGTSKRHGSWSSAPRYIGTTLRCQVRRCGHADSRGPRPQANPSPT